MANAKCLLRKLIAESRIVCNDSFLMCIFTSHDIGSMRCILSLDAALTSALSYHARTYRIATTVATHIHMTLGIMTLQNNLQFY